MINYVIGCDPDSKANGIALYENGALTELMSLAAIDFYLEFERLRGERVVFCVENTKKNGATFRKNGDNSEAKRRKIARDVGNCQQAQVEIVRAAEKLGFDVVYMPISKRWKEGEIQTSDFKRLTGWTKRSNPDTRSAAWMGYLYSKQS